MTATPQTPVSDAVVRVSADERAEDVLSVHNPLSGDELYRIQELAPEEADGLFQEMRQQHRRLRRTSIAERVKELKRLRDVVFEQRENIIDRIVAETGKSRTDAQVSEVLGVLDYLDWLIRIAPRILRDRKVSTPPTLLGKKSVVYHESLGTVLIIAPWNYPFHIGLTSIAAALAAGNAVVFKPSELTPLKGLIEQLMQACPLLQEAVRIVYGSGETARLLIDQRPAKIFFTGSARTGRKILAQAAEYLIPVELELGGKDAAIVFGDANLERTVAGVLWGAMTNAGQSCTSIERLYVQSDIYDAFVERLKTEAEALVVNAGDDGNADMGSLTAGFQLEIIRRHVEQARERGGQVLTGGAVLHEGSLFYLPTLIEVQDRSLDGWQQETFGPTIMLSRFETEEEVIAEANALEYGLSASVWTADLKRAERVARRLEVGAVSVNNVMLTEGNPALPFGGVKGSGFGRVKGEEGLLGMVSAKAVIFDKQSGKVEANWYPYTRQKYQAFDRLMAALADKSWLKWLRFAVAGLRLESIASKKRDQVS